MYFATTLQIALTLSEKIRFVCMLTLRGEQAGTPPSLCSFLNMQLGLTKGRQ